ncbi:protein salivary glands marred [Lutzomyia longipalpis]|uniref:protein salivary glands marred n=1 Tax=Lutzomyia longipalpis TaxID=7200 RepID=UPI002484316F|nr:protein salivary glands marred [Lutzomyia longipalpis]XP_055695287.1 protein salivary glands marred [Lutzomyia longipalpis]XP_055695288.1 protein salivary glands marred [Lutzomyia longipalpis]XP_055695289.1 protein salivary glands marred [Lutzomyia longipalpis]XP_055695290.1 protein salivary glands marred [Lutzomyia longipalpis]XP_055695291.1 protein salivary glands marred [Lutzomyia longipalpis]XP_055695292.1 protein salivary glands marred [Lutzomyia longipalpis]
MITVMSDSASAFRARDIGLRAQKKILSRMANKSIAKSFIDDTTASLLDNIYRLAKLHSDKKQAEKLVKNIIKIVIKIGVLIRNEEFNDAELQTAEKFRKKFQVTQMAIISFHEVDFSFDINYLQKALAECQYLLKSIIKRHLTEKSIARVDEIFKFFRDDKLLEMAFRPNSPYSDVMANLVSDLNKSLDEGDSNL